jgi:methylenetetrahydrofolate reductase (NADPH)
MAELNGTPIPEAITRRFVGHEDNPEAVREIGIEIATELSQKLITAKVPGLHFYTMNTSTATLQIVKNIGMARGA